MVNKKEQDVKYRRKNGKLFLLVGTGIGMLCIASVFIVLKGCQQKQIVKKPQIYKVAPDKYDIFVEVWNKRVNQAHVGGDFYLKQLDPNAIIDKLNDLLKPFFKRFTQDIKDEFSTLQKEDKYSLFIMYDNFLHHYNVQEKNVLSPSMPSVEIKKILCRLTKRDSLDKETK